MKRTISMILCILITVSIFSGCGAGNSTSISAISREEGSGTRGAFVELFGIEQKNASGEKVDYTTPKSETTNSTSVMMTTVAGNKNAVGYISLGSLNDTVKAVKIDGTEATAENIKNGEYKISRPFNIVTKKETDSLTKDFISFIISSEGQEIVEKAGYISIGSTEAYSSEKLSGRIAVSGSSSVSPVMEKLKEAYMKINPDVTVEVQQTDSSTGISDAIAGTSNIGMASRELKDSEISEGLNSTVIALDGIAVIVNKESEITELTSEQVKRIYMGEITDWTEIKD